MSANDFRAAKVLLLEHDPQHYQDLLDFCNELGLKPLPRSAVNAVATLAEHLDLAGVLLAEDLPGVQPDSLGLAQTIHRQRPELPIFLRRTSARALSGPEAAAIKHAWAGGDTASLRAAVERSLYGLRYPPELVQGVLELTLRSIRSMFPHAEVGHEPPYVVHDRIIFGEVSTLIALESTWCRGYMMLQTEESALRQGLLQGFGLAGVGGDLNFRELNHLLGETTNLIWGAFKNRYIPPEAFANQQTQVPIVINHHHKYMSFGSEDPQLCVRYLLSDPRRPGLPPLTIVQRLIFNLLWLPEKFTEYAAPPDQAANTGELELF
ncbi:chemotaxis protein CheX [Rubrivivax rivuli]|uniref:Chemotaxis protein CheX n=1 Tax=Rubrivivax rivuli TaxID=1862385 RepID=A0A437RLI5_9BURK|nr:chemotaxis protein CheX [Rubrivivax rivuli]RVU47614.1 chemotaxis protein CheX [Rubrivivax rivuli]